jgi:hypothetical protein
LAIPLVFFSLSRSKLPQYILPLMPAVALLLASRWQSGVRRPLRTPFVGAAGWLVFGAVMVAARAGALEGSRVPATLLDVLPTPVTVMAIVCLASVIWTIAAVRSERGGWLIAALSLPLVALPMVLHPVISTLSELRSERSLVALIRTELPTETEVLGLEAWRPSVSFYLGRPVPILSRDGDELRSNYILRTYDRWAEPTGVLRPAPSSPGGPEWCDQPTVFLVHTKRTDLQTALENEGRERIWAGPKIHAFYCDPLQPADAAAAEETPDPQ